MDLCGFLICVFYLPPGVSVNMLPAAVSTTGFLSLTQRLRRFSHHVPTKDVCVCVCGCVFGSRTSNVQGNEGGHRQMMKGLRSAYVWGRVHRYRQDTPARKSLCRMYP